MISPGFVPTTAAENVRGLSRFFLRHVLSHMPFATSVDDSASNMARLLGTDALEPGGGRDFVRWVEASASPDARDLERAASLAALLGAGDLQGVAHTPMCSYPAGASPSSYQGIHSCPSSGHMSGIESVSQCGAQHPPDWHSGCHRALRHARPNAHAFA